MQTNEFPEAYNQQVDQKTQAKLTEVLEKVNDQHREVSAKRDSLLSSIEKPSEPSSKEGDGVSWVVWGIGLGFFLCMCECFGGFAIGSEQEGLELGISTFIVIAVIAAVIGGILEFSRKQEKRAFRERSEAANRSYEAVNRSYEAERQRIQSEYEANKQRIESDAEAEKQRYYVEFENNVQRRSIELAESKQAKTVIEWITAGFCRTIDAADRRSHIKEIRVPFDFKVYTSAIDCNIGRFDFEENLCRFLDGPVEQAALARAIASAIQLKITMAYPKDVSGTDTSIELRYIYNAESGNDRPGYVESRITYVAPNGNYKPASSW